MGFPIAVRYIASPGGCVNELCSSLRDDNGTLTIDILPLRVHLPGVGFWYLEEVSEQRYPSWPRQVLGLLRCQTAQQEHYNDSSG